MTRIALFSLGLLSLGACLPVDELDPTADEADYTAGDDDTSTDTLPDGQGGGTLLTISHDRSRDETLLGVHGQAKGNGGGGKPTSNGIDYHGGPVMLGTPNVYYIWYGTWDDPAERSVLTDLASNIGGTPYWNINTTYYDGTGTHLSNSVAFGGETTDAYSQGSTNLSDSAIASVVSRALGNGSLPVDTNGIYVVLTSEDVTKSGFCTSYCGWHTHASMGGKDIKYSFVGNPEQCPTACSAQDVSPNGYLGADAMASIIAHELEEAATDPDLSAWYDRRGYENADKCAWTFGTVSTDEFGADYNMTIGPRRYLIQRNWVNGGGGYCSLSY